MPTKFLTALIACALVAPAVASAAQSADSDLAPITRDEALARADTLFELLDTNHDGVLTRPEALRSALRLRALAASLHRDIAQGIGGHTAKFFRTRFAKAHSVTRAEFEQAMLAHFDAMDANHDGVLSSDERAAAQ